MQMSHDSISDSEITVSDVMKHNDPPLEADRPRSAQAQIPSACRDASLILAEQLLVENDRQITYAVVKRINVSCYLNPEKNFFGFVLKF